MGGAAATWIALLRGVNVGGSGVLPMQELRALLADLGYGSVRTYIQSGNCIFTSTATATRIADEIADGIAGRFGFHPDVLVLSPVEIEAALAANPFCTGDAEPKSIHLFFLAEPAPDTDLAGLRALASGSEALHLADSVLYVFAPDGIGRSRMVAKIDRFIPLATTARNLRTVRKIAEMMRETA